MVYLAQIDDDVYRPKKIFSSRDKAIEFVEGYVVNTLGISLRDLDYSKNSNAEYWAYTNYKRGCVFLTIEEMEIER